VKRYSLPVACALAVFATALSAAAQGMPPLPKPGPDQQIFRDDAGTWDAKVESMMPPSTSKGTETNTLSCGGLCLVTDFKGEFAGMPFEGHGTTVYDPAKKKYVGSWTDSLSTGLQISEAVWDAKTKTMTGSMEGPDMEGKVMKARSTVEYKADGTRVFTLFMNGPDGKEMAGMKITYTKRK
jgi:hypothetical protein